MKQHDDNTFFADLSKEGQLYFSIGAIVFTVLMVALGVALVINL